MTTREIMMNLRSGDLMNLYEEGVLDVALLRLAVENNYIDVDTATMWYETLMDI